MHTYAVPLFSVFSDSDALAILVARGVSWHRHDVSRIRGIDNIYNMDTIPLNPLYNHQ